MTAEKESVYVPSDHAYRDNIRDKIAADIDNGELDKLTFALGRIYGLKSDGDIRLVQHELTKSGHLKKSGKKFVANKR